MNWMLMPFKRYADFSGRSRRMEFWMWVLFQVIVYFVLMILMMVVGGGAIMAGAAADPSAMAAAGGGIMIIMVIYLLYALVAFIPNLAVQVRRLHDTNRSGWWILAPIAPYVLVFVAGAMATSSPDMAAVAGVVALISLLAVFVLGLTLLVFFFLEGTKGPNQYGPDPKGQDTGQVFA